MERGNSGDGSYSALIGELPSDGWFVRHAAAWDDSTDLLEQPGAKGPGNSVTFINCEIRDSVRNGYRYVLPDDPAPRLDETRWNWDTGYVDEDERPDPLAGPLLEQREDWLIFGGDDRATFKLPPPGTGDWLRADRVRLDVRCEVGQVVIGVGPLLRDIPEQRSGVERPVPPWLPGADRVRVVRSYVNPGGHVRVVQLIGCSFDGGWRFDTSIKKQMDDVRDTESAGVLVNEAAGANLIGCHFEGHRYTSVLLRSYWWIENDQGEPQHRGATASVLVGNHYADPLTVDSPVFRNVAPEDRWLPEAGTHVLELRSPEEGWTSGTATEPGPTHSGPCNLDYDRALWGYRARPDS